MKKFLILAILFFASVLSVAQNPYAAYHSYAATTSGADLVINLQNSGAAFHSLTWYVTGTVSACSVKVEQSVNGTSGWTDLIAGQTCTSNGQTAIVNSTVNYVRINFTTFTGTGNVQAVYGGFVSSSMSWPLRAQFSNAGLPLTAVTTCGIATHTGIIKGLILLSDVLGNATIDISTETLAQYLAGTTATSITNSHPATFTNAKGISVVDFSGWTTTTIVDTNVYCFALSSPSSITLLSVMVTF